MTITLVFKFVTNGAELEVTLVQLNGKVTTTALDSRMLVSLPSSDHERCLEWIRDTTAAISSAPAVSHHFPRHDNYQEYAHLVAWTSPNEEKFKEYAYRLQYDNDLLLEFARKHELTYIIEMLQPRTHTITMHNLVCNDKPYSINVTLTKANGEITATYTVQGKLTADDLKYATTAIGIMRDIVSGHDMSPEIETLRSVYPTFDESAFVYVAVLTKNKYLSDIEACVRPGSVNAQVISALPW